MSDRDFWRLFSYLMLAIGSFTVVIYIAAQVIGSKNTVASAGAAALSDKAVAERIKPVGKVVVRSQKSIIDTIIPKANAAPDGMGAYNTACGFCHNTGATGAPILGDKGAWKKRIAQGKATLYQNSIRGFKAMPPKGGSSLTDAKVKAAVDYIVDKSK